MSAVHDAMVALVEGRSLTDAEAEAAIGEIMDGAPDSVAAAFLVALKIKGAEAEELAGGVRAMLKRARPLKLRDPEALARCLDAAGCCHIFAPAYHPGFARLAPLRRELKIRTIFNLMGSIGSPARPYYHLLGVAENNLIMPMARALKTLGTRRAMVVRGADAIDEISVS